MQFTVFFEFIYRCWHHVHTKHENLVYYGIRTETRQRIDAVHCSRGIYLSVYLYLIIKLCLFV